MRMIDADALLTDRRMRMYYHLPNGDIAVPVIDIEHAPTIEERKTGEWIDAVSSDHYKCSLCGFYAPYSSPYCEWLSDYCPNCGARMEG